MLFRSIPPCRNRIGFALLLWTLTAAAQSPALPRFEDYPVKALYDGPHAPPILATPDQRFFQTRIRNGVSKGEGVRKGDGSRAMLTKPETNFAGKLVVIAWGCGSPCVTMAIADAVTGKVYSPPLADPNRLRVPLDSRSRMETEFRRDSSLIVLRDACRNLKDRKTCGTYYFNWKDHGFQLIRFLAAEAR